MLSISARIGYQGIYIVSKGNGTLTLLQKNTLQQHMWFPPAPVKREKNIIHFLQFQLYKIVFIMTLSHQNYSQQLNRISTRKYFSKYLYIFINIWLQLWIRNTNLKPRIPMINLFLHLRKRAVRKITSIEIIWQYWIDEYSAWVPRSWRRRPYNDGSVLL